ncbi:MAG: MFS transporter, partial [Flavobacteriales bacterium CG_4_10_14_0_2_um_filter_32_8]
MSFQKNDKKIINAWTMYDWANSVYPLVITTAIFPIFYEAVVPEKITFFGREFVNTEIYSYVVSLSFIIVAILSPILSGIADYAGNKKNYMRFFCYLGALSCISLYFFDVKQLELSMLSVLLASIGFSGSLVFYNAYLPEIATVDFHDKVSAKGFSRGYIGSSLLLIVCLVLIQVFHIEPRYAFVLTGFWWIGFSQITFNGLPKNSYNHHPKENQLTRGFNELKKVWVQIKKLKSLRRYLASFFVYSMGVQTVMLMAVFFGTKEIIWESENEMQTGLIISILIIQFIAIAGAYLMAFLSKKIGNIKTLAIVVLIWAIICVVAYTLIYTPVQFYIIAAIIGFVMGGIQSLSRSTYSKLL